MRFGNHETGGGSRRYGHSQIELVGAFASRYFEGGHFFVHAAEPALLAAIRADLSRALMLSA